MNTQQSLDISERIKMLSEARIEARTLQEILKIDFDTLLSVIAPDMPRPNFTNAGISAKMSISGVALCNHLGADELRRLRRHKSDTVRGLVAFGLANELDGADVGEVLTEIRPFAADQHFGVREWAWLAVRPLLARELTTSIDALAGWTKEADVRIRRFAVEALRPRGVWCKHIPELRKTPELGLPLLVPMRTESEKYAQDSVANWLNDAAKDRPEWVLELSNEWLRIEAGNRDTERIVRRATRSIKSD